MAGPFDDIKGEGIKWLAVIAGLFLFVIVINAIMISVWLVIIPILLIGVGWLAWSYYRANR